MTFLGIVGILLSLVAIPLASRRTSDSRLFLLLLLLMHIAASIIYYLYSLGNPADSFLYYYDPLGMVNYEFSFGTILLVKLVATLKTYVGGTYLDYFMLFQAFGYWGILLLWRVVGEIHDQLEMPRTALSFWIFLVPGVHFWTSALGKDAPLFFATSLAVWAAIRIGRRLAFFALAIAIMVLFRPHIALIAVVAMAVAALFDRRTTFPIKAVLLIAASAGAAYVIQTVQATFAVDVTDPESISAFFESQHEVAETVEGSTSMVDAGFFAKLGSLLFRPLFFDAEGIFAIVASFESLFFLFVFAFLVTHVGQGLTLVRRVFFLRFAVLFVACLTVLLTLVFYNVGLGARQKMMLVPPLFAFFVAQWAIHRRRVRTSVSPVAAAPPRPAEAAADG